MLAPEVGDHPPKQLYRVPAIRTQRWAKAQVLDTGFHQRLQTRNDVGRRADNADLQHALIDQRNGTPWIPFYHHGLPNGRKVRGSQPKSGENQRIERIAVVSDLLRQYTTRRRTIIVQGNPDTGGKIKRCLITVSAFSKPTGFIKRTTL